jgi:uncharacterized protein (DUF2141 family)
MFRRFVVHCATLALIGLVLCLPVAGQAKGSGSISGKVTLGGKPAKGIPVTASGDPTAAGQRTAGSTATTDDHGEYQITGLAAGRYAVSPYKPADVLPGRTQWETGSKVVTLGESEAARDIDFSLSAGGVITGRITGPDGRPLIEQRITLESEDGKTVFGGIFGNEMFRTDDRGIYRIFGLPAGRYLVSVGEERNSDTITVGLTSNSYFPRTYFPRSTRKAEARVLELSEGSVESNIDISIGPREKTFSISGIMIEEATGKQVANVPVAFGAVVAGGTSIGAFGTSSNTDSSGQFKLTSLKPGKYGVFAGGFTETDKWTSDPVIVEITDSDVSDVEIKLRAGISIDGIAVVEGTTDPETIRKVSQLRVQIYSTRSSNSGTLQAPNGRVTQFGPDNSFHIDGLSPSKYFVYIIQAGNEQLFSLRRVEQEGVPTPDSMIDIAPGAEHLNVRLVLETGSGVIRGQVNIVGGSLPTGWRLTGTVRRPGPTGIGGRSVSIDARGRFVVEHLAAGEYEISINAFPPIGQNRGSTALPSVRRTVNVSGSGETNVTLTLDLSQRAPGSTPQ